MRPLLLTMRSFGPFAAEQKADFTCYGDNAFLLIHGVTGSGKTTILDGICYALYGNASGEKREDHYLRSQFALPESVCEVEFMFQVGPRRFQIKRTPPQLVMQKGKERKLIHQVEFCQIDEQGEIIGERMTKVVEIQKKVEEVIGFTSSQFRQVVVLPQGEFRKLLLAKSDEKEQILENLFGTERYKQVEELLKRRKSSIAGELKELKAAVEGILSSNGVVTTENLQERIAAIAAERARLTAAITAQEIQLIQAQERLLAAQSLVERFTEQQEASKAYFALEQQKPKMDKCVTQIDRARKALGLSDLSDAVQRADRELITQRDQLFQLDASISSLELNQKSALERTKHAKEVSDTIPALTAEQSNLTTHLEKIKELVTCKAAVNSAQKVANEAKTSVDTIMKSIVDNETHLTTLTERIETLSLKSGTFGQLAAELEKFATLLTSRKTFDTDTTALKKIMLELTSKEKSVEGANHLHTHCEQKYNDLQQSFIKGQSAMLAKELIDGSPCPVCGSDKHPHPASLADHIPSEKELEKAKKSVAEALKQLQTADKELNQLVIQKSGLESGIAALKTSLGSDAGSSIEELTAKKKNLEQLQAEAQAAVDELVIIRKQRELVTQTIFSSKQNLSVAEAKLLTASAELEKHKGLSQRLEKETVGDSQPEAEARLKKIKQTIQAAGIELEQAEAELKEIDAQLARLKGQREEKRGAIPRLQTELKRLNDEFAARLAFYGFNDELECKSARLSLHEIECLQQETDKFRDGLTAAAERLQRATKACKGLEQPDLVEIIAARDEIDRKLGDLRKEGGILQGQQNGFDDALKSIIQKDSLIKVLESEYAVTGRLADVTSGNNPKRMTLQRYVLAALFEEVAMAASQRLSLMSRGRYHLVRSETVRDNRATSGLDLDVTDDNTGEKRPAFTLSGGESFLASLSLALGLSDVVMAQCGGRYLDCIFIDEGFGSLDGETLDFALNTLIELHRSGRMIGIISHVAELKERIPSRIQVVGSNEGSRILQQTA